jgi:hypothetical protein
MDRFGALIPEEGQALRRLRSQGSLLEAWSPGKPGAVLIVEAASEAEGASVIAELPLSVAGLIEFDLVPLYDMGV